MKCRQANLEALRIVSMGMIIVLHYLEKGGFLVELISGIKWGAYLVWVLEASCIVAVNLFVLLTGYLMVEKQFTKKRMVNIWLQVLWYSVGIGILCICTGVISIEELTVYRILPWIFPILSEHYWFLSAYMILLLCMPFLNVGIEVLSKKQLQGLMLIGIGIYSVSKSLLPIPNAFDRYGCDIEWMICVYLVGAYCKKYGVIFYKTGKEALLGYVVCVGIMVSWLYACTNWNGQVEAIYEWRRNIFHYNHMVNLIGAFSLFRVFLGLEIKQEWIRKGIMAISPYVLGVYLLHEHVELRYRWTIWLGVIGEYTLLGRIGNFALCMILLFVLGVSADKIRSVIYTECIVRMKKRKGFRRHE